MLLWVRIRCLGRSEYVVGEKGCFRLRAAVGIVRSELAVAMGAHQMEADQRAMDNPQLKS